MVQKKIEHKLAKCPFCTKDLSFHVEDGKKVVDEPCDCAESKFYFSKEEVNKRAEAERKERVRLGYEKPRKGDIVDGRVFEGEQEGKA